MLAEQDIQVGSPVNKHQHAVATQYHLQAPTLISYFNSDGQYLHAIIALGDEAGDRGFYKSIRENKVENFSAKEYTNPDDSNEYY